MTSAASRFGEGQHVAAARCPAAFGRRDLALVEGRTVPRIEHHGVDFFEAGRNGRHEQAAVVREDVNDAVKAGAFPDRFAGRRIQAHQAAAALKDDAPRPDRDRREASSPSSASST